MAKWTSLAPKACPSGRRASGHNSGPPGLSLQSVRIVIVLIWVSDECPTSCYACGLVVFVVVVFVGLFVRFVFQGSGTYISKHLNVFEL